MSEVIDTQTESALEVELEALKTRAKIMGIPGYSNMKLETLKSRIEQKLTETEPPEATDEDSFDKSIYNSLTKQFDKVIAAKDISKTSGYIIRFKNEATKPIKCLITDLETRNKEADNPLIPFCVGNVFFRHNLMIPKDKKIFLPQYVINALKLKRGVKMVKVTKPTDTRPLGTYEPKTYTRYVIQIFK